MGINPQFDIWNHFFRIRLSSGSGVEAAVLDGVEVYVKSRHGVEPYFYLPMSDFSNGWQKVGFSLRNDAITALPAFTGNHPVPQPNWWYGVAKRDLCKLQYLCEVIQQL
jgi:hypothetical protein